MMYTDGTFSAAVMVKMSRKILMKRQGFITNLKVNGRGKK